MLRGSKESLEVIEQEISTPRRKSGQNVRTGLEQLGGGETRQGYCIGLSSKKNALN